MPSKSSLKKERNKTKNFLFFSVVFVVFRLFCCFSLSFVVFIVFGCFSLFFVCFLFFFSSKISNSLTTNSLTTNSLTLYTTTTTLIQRANELLPDDSAAARDVTKKIKKSKLAIKKANRKDY